MAELGLFGRYFTFPRSDFPLFEGKLPSLYSDVLFELAFIQRCGRWRVRREHRLFAVVYTVICGASGTRLMTAMIYRSPGIRLCLEKGKFCDAP